MEIHPDPNGFEKLLVTAPEWDANFEVYGVCPVQAFGTVRGRDIYFRSRNGRWSFDVADSGGRLPSDGYLYSDGYSFEGIDLHNGYMPPNEAVAIIAECLRVFVKDVHS